MTMNLFENVADIQSAEATFQTHIEAGNLAGAVRLVESLPFQDAYKLVLMSGFSIVGGRDDKKSFYEYLGKQIRIACEKKTLPINGKEDTF